jgi:hypothetical protein
MMFYKFTLKNLMIDSLVIGLGAFSLYSARTVAKASIDGSTIGLAEAYLITLAGGIFLVRWSYLAWSYFYGENANKKPSLLFKVHKGWVTFCSVIAFIMYFGFIYILIIR